MESRSYGYTAQTRVGKIEFTYRPLIDVEVGGSEKRRTFKALIDSGSDITVMDKVIADLLEINEEGQDSAELSALGKITHGFLAPVSLQFEGFPDVFNFTVLFVENLSQNFDIILGQQDFFNNFDVTFKKSKNLFYLTIAQ